MELLLRSNKYFFFYKSILETLPTPFQTKLLFHNIKRLKTVTWLVVRGPWNLGSGTPGRWWFLRYETTQRINPTKQGYCLIIVPATGVFWSTVWSTIRPPASATPLYPGIVYKPDLRLGYGNRQLGTSTLIPELDGFIWPVSVCCLCIQLIRGGVLYTITPSS